MRDSSIFSSSARKVYPLAALVRSEIGLDSIVIPDATCLFSFVPLILLPIRPLSYRVQLCQRWVRSMNMHAVRTSDIAFLSDARARNRALARPGSSTAMPYPR